MLGTLNDSGCNRWIGRRDGEGGLTVSAETLALVKLDESPPPLFSAMTERMMTGSPRRFAGTRGRKSSKNGRSMIVATTARVTTRSRAIPIDAAQIVCWREGISFPCSYRRLIFSSVLNTPMRRIAFVGTCQLESLHGLFAQYVVPQTRDELVYIPSYDRLQPSALQALRQADLIIEQLQDFELKADIEAAASGIDRRRVPLLAAGFLWPLAGQPHPANQQLPPGTLSRFTQETSDSFLNRMVLKGVDPQEAVRTYLALDLNCMVGLDRLYEISIGQQRKRDQATGYELAGLIEQYFRREHIFATPHHPGLRVFRALAEQFFRHMDVSGPVIDRMLRRLRTPPLVLDQLPIHPSVIRHFGLDFLGDNPSWRFTEEGSFSTEAYYLKYMRFEWNRDLDAGLVHWNSGKLEIAMERLDCAISTSPKAARAYFARSNIFWRWGQMDEAVVNAQQAVEFGPHEREFRLHLVHLLLKMPASECQREALLQQAEREARGAVRLDPDSWHARAVLSHVLEHRRCYAEAIACLNDAICLEPEEPDFHACLGRLNERLDNLEAAETAYRRAVTLSQGDAHYRRVLSHFMAHRASRFSAP